MKDKLRSAWEDAVMFPVACPVLTFVSTEKPWETSVRVTGLKSRKSDLG
jgi:hypothetical protein